MKNIKPIVQVMNLFSLVRINSAKSKVEEFGMTSSVLTKIISSIMYNDNIVLDKNSIEPDASKPVLNIYIASDYGFCSSYNQVVSQKIKETKKYRDLFDTKYPNFQEEITKPLESIIGTIYCSTFKDADGNRIKFNTPAAALMYFISEGWDLYITGGTTTGGSFQGTGGTSTTSYWIFGSVNRTVSRL